MSNLKETIFGVLVSTAFVFVSGYGVVTYAEKNPVIDSRPCYTTPSDLGRVVTDLTKRVGDLEEKVNRLEREQYK